MVFVAPGREVEEGLDFELWHETVERPLRTALTAAFGVDRGREATAEALAWAWEHQDRLATLERPVAYLFRVGQSRTRIRKSRILHGRSEWSEPWFEPALGRGLAALTQRQRVTVVLIHGYGWTYAEVAELLGIRVTTVQNHLDRGLARLRSALEATAHD